MSQINRKPEESHSTLINDDEDNATVIGSSVGQIDEELMKENGITILDNQLSSDELVSDLDVIKTNLLVDEGRAESILNNEEQYHDDDVDRALVAYTKIDVWDVVKKSAINLILPIINGFMLGFGEILAHEVGFRYNWFGARVTPPRRMERKREQQSQYL